MKDALSFAKGHASRTISGAYISMATKAPSLFGGLYRLGGAISSAVEEQLRSERFKAELITNVSHDLKTPSPPSSTMWTC